MSFPASPVLNEIFIANGKAWKFDGTNWVIPQKASTLPWQLVTNTPTYFPADWSSTLANIPDYFNAKVISSQFPPTNQVTGTLWWDEVNRRLYIYQTNVWVETAAALREKFISIDPDVINYVTAVEAADGAPLEQEVVTAFEAFILGCKIDGIWNAIKSSCILAGARTIAGATIPLKGTAPTNSIVGNYNRKGLKRTSTTGTYNTGRNNNADPQNNRHLSIYITEASGVSGRMNLIGAAYGMQGSTYIIASNEFSQQKYYASSASASSGDFSLFSTSAENSSLGFLATSRNVSTQITFRANGINQNLAGVMHNPSTTPANANIQLASNINYESQGGTQRTAFYSIGESIDLEKLDARVTKLMTTLSTVIP